MLVDCSCQPGEEYADGSQPEFYGDRQKARNAYIHHQFNGTLYWGVHFKGQHLIGPVKLYLAPVGEYPAEP
jgi:hypothetical protein